MRPVVSRHGPRHTLTSVGQPIRGHASMQGQGHSTRARCGHGGDPAPGATACKQHGSPTPVARCGPPRLGVPAAVRAGSAADLLAPRASRPVRDRTAQEWMPPGWSQGYDAEARARDERIEEWLTGQPGFSELQL